MKTTFWLTIAKTIVSTEALPYTLSLFDQPPTAGVEPIHRLTRSTHLSLTSRARNKVDGGQDARQTYGNALAQWLFGGEIQGESLNPIGAYLQNAASGAHESQQVRLCVCVEPAIFRWPDFLHHGFFQCLSANTIVPLEAVRSLVVNEAGHRLSHAPFRPPVVDKLRVLVVVSNPTQCQENKFKHLSSLDKDFTALMASLTPLQQHHAIFIEELRQPSGEMLEMRLRQMNPHVFVFLGHGYDDATGSGLVCVEQVPVEHRAQRWPYDRFQHVQDESQGGSALRLVVLMACRSFDAAPALLARGIPAVVGMQKYGTYDFDFPSDGLAPFAVPFFTAVSDFVPITTAFAKGVESLQEVAWQDEALREAKRKAKKFDEESGRRHLKAAAVMPTLWLAGEEDHLFAESEERMRASYHTALSSKLENCEWSGRSGHVPLMKVFVPPSVGETRTDKLVDLETSLSENRALVLQGPEWSGKTTIAHWVVRTAFEQKQRTPLLVNLRELERNNQSLEQWLVETCRRWLGLHSPEAVTALIMEDCRKGKAVLVIDDVEYRWVRQPPEALRERLFGEQETDTTVSIVVTSKAWEQACHREWVALRIEPLTSEQQQTVAQRYGEVFDIVPATRDFLERVGAANKQPDGVTPLARRSGFWVEMLAQFLRKPDLLTDESDLLDRLQQTRWKKPVEPGQMIHPDEPVYKQRMLEALGFHLYVCGRGAARGNAGEAIMPTLLGSVLQDMDLGEGPIYPPDVATRLLDEHVDIRPMLQRTEAGWAFRSAEWKRFYAASQLAAAVNDQDPAVLAWIKDGKSVHCRYCDTNLGMFKELVTPERMEQVLVAVKVAQEEELPAWQRTDPWDCPEVHKLRRVLVRALPLNPIDMAARG